MSWFWKFFYPKYCCLCGEMGEWLCERCKSDLRWIELKCPSCGRETAGGRKHERCEGDLSGLIAIYDYKQDEARGVVKAFKYKLVKSLGRLLLEGVNLGVRKGEFDCLVPVALHRRRENWRGFNQAKVLAELINERVGVGVEDVLERVRYTQPLVELDSYRQRKEEIKGVFEVKEGCRGKIRDKRVLLVDDVFTSGSTMREAAKTLKRVGVREIWGWVLASK